MKTAPSARSRIFWVLSAAFNAHPSITRRASCWTLVHPVSVCPLDYFPACGIRSGRHIELQAADGSPVEHNGSREVIYKMGEEVMKVHFEGNVREVPDLEFGSDGGRWVATWTSRQSSDTEAW